MPQCDQLHLFAAGYPCQANSNLNSARYQSDPVLSEEARVFVAIVELIKIMQPEVFVLENVAGLKCVRVSGRPGTVLDWVNSKLVELLGGKYEWDHFVLQSYRLLLVLSHVLQKQLKLRKLFRSLIWRGL